MAITYITICLTVIFTHVTSIPSAFVEIVKMAFTGRAAVAGVIGITIRDAIKEGVSKGIFTNEAGLGSAPIAIATAKSNDATKQGLISMTSTFMGTVIICMMTGLCIVITGAWDAGLEGIDITSFAFETGLPFTNPIISAILVFICITCFAFTTIIGWNLYGSKCLDYFTNGNKKAYLVYQWIYVITLLLGPFLKVDVIWGIANIFNGLMAAPNLIALLALAPKLSKETNQYFVEYKEKNKMVSE
ncbi:amino acid carrier protein [Firmicutes bacterium CAG:313]|nr:amino acid carrier protein [Firmicutes bacterium CAG:313]